MTWAQKMRRKTKQQQRINFVVNATREQGRIIVSTVLFAVEAYFGAPLPNDLIELVTNQAQAIVKNAKDEPVTTETFKAAIVQVVNDFKAVQTEADTSK